jgi:hypothetical protein
MSTVVERFQEWNTVETARDSNLKMVRSFMVTLEAGEENMTDVAVLALTGIPPRFSRPTGITYVECVQRSVRLEAGDKRHRIVTCQYEQAPSGSDPEYVKPWQRPAVVNFRGVSLAWVDGRAYRDDDTEGNPTRPIQDSAGTLFDTPPSRTISRLGIQITRSELDEDFDPNDLRDYRETINKNAIVVGGVAIDGKCGLMRDIRAESRLWLDPDQSPDTTDPSRQLLYWVVTYEIEASIYTIEEKILDQGPYYWVGEVGTGTKTPFIRNGREYDGKLVSGAKLSDPDNPDTKPSWRAFQMNFAKDWQYLNLPRSRQGT